VSDYSVFEEIALYVQDQLRRVGVRMDIQTVDQGVLNERRNTGEFEALFNFVASDPKWLRQHLGNDSPLGYSNTRVATLLDRAVVTVDPEAQDRIYQELMDIFRVDVPVTFLFPRVEYVFVHRRLQGLSSPWRADPVEHMGDLWLEEKE
jgi:ABC-type transport system substrate-binding protein